MNGIIGLLETYKYFVLFPLAIIEGPILTVIAGFLVSLGLMDAYIVLPLVVIADALGDSLQYALGRFGSNFLHTRGRWIGITTEKLDRAKAYFKDHHIKSVALSKLVHGIGSIGIVAAGNLKVPYQRFAITALVISLLQSTVLLVAGIFFGYAYVQIAHYLTYFAAVAALAIVIGASIWILLRWKKKLP